MNAPGAHNRVDRAVQDVQLFKRCSAETVDEHRHTISPAKRHLAKQVFEHLVREFVGSFELASPDSRLSMYAHPEANLVVRDLKRRLSGFRHDAWRQRNAD